MSIKRFILTATPELSLGVFLIFSSSIGQTFFISLFSGEIRNEFDRRAPYRARVFDLVHYYSNLDPKGIKKKIELNSIKQTQPQLTG